MTDSKQTIAIDIDDVLAANAPAFVAFSNERWGTNLTVDDYVEHWGEFWKVDADELHRRSEIYHASGVIGRYEHAPEALPVLKHLATKYRLAIVTSRRAVVSEVTIEWIDRYYKGLFDEIRFAGFYDNQFGVHHTKAEICRDLGAAYLIDDQLKHCLAAAEAGIDAVLFGEYGWNRQDKLPPRVHRARDWQAVGKYFDDRAD
jgi:5'(3')-deoxyribonucleotidase